MQCEQCGEGATDRAKFCGQCGHRLEWICSSCTSANGAEHRFCVECGERRSDEGDPGPHDGAAPAEPTTSTPVPHAEPVRATADGERRHLTVMFCDLVGSTSMSESLDPEELQAIMLAYQHAAAGAIEAEGGYVGHYMGDGILAYFGYPIADENPEVRAVRAAFGVLDAMSSVRERHPAVDVRVGVHSGITVVADMGVGEQRQLADVVGETPNIAARVQGAAAPGTIAVSATTHRECQGFIELRSMGFHALKGLSSPVELFEAVSDTGATDRLDVASAADRLTPFAGRESEVDVLVNAWRRTQVGDGQVVWISGEPGIGKSRLVRELVDRVRVDDGIEIDLRCSQLHVASSLHSSADQFRRAVLAYSGKLDIAGVEVLADENGTPRALAVPVIAELLGIPLVEPYRAVEGSTDHVRQHTLDVIARLIEDRAKRQPVLLVIDDLQWIDSTSAEMVERFIGPDQRSDVMTVVTFRSNHRPEIPASSQHQRLELERLDPNAIRSIIGWVLERWGPIDDLVSQISDRSDGVPLFAEELAELFRDDVMAAGRLVPSNLRDSMMARLDRLGPEADLVRMLSIFGRQAEDPLLFDVSGLDRDTFDERIEQLLEDRMIVRRQNGRDATYSVRHALLDDVAYESMLYSTRRRLHARVAAALELRSLGRTVTEPEMVARHHTLAGDPVLALPYLLRAGERAIAISAHDEALVHFRAALDVVEELPAGGQRDGFELDALIGLGVPTTATLGYGSSEAEEVYARAEAVADRLGDTADVYPALYGMFRTRLLQADYTSAEDLAARLVTLAEAAPHRPELALGAHRAFGSILFYQGHDLRAALSHLQTALEAPDSERPGAYLAQLNDVVDPIITCRSYAAWVHWMVGEPDLARKLSDQSIIAARRLAHPFSLGLALCFDAWLLQFEGDVEGTMVRAREAKLHAEEHGFPFWVGWARVLLGWGQSQQGNTGTIAEMREGIAQWRAQGSQLGVTYFLALIAEAELAAGEHEAAEQTLNGALDLVESRNEHFWHAEILRLRAETRRAAGRPGVVDLLDEAAQIADAQGASALLGGLDQSRSDSV